MRWSVWLVPLLLLRMTSCLRVGQRFVLDDGLAAELEEWEVRWLKDAVRRGRGFVSREQSWDDFARSLQGQQNTSPPGGASSIQSTSPHPSLFRPSLPSTRPIAATDSSEFLGSFDLPVVNIGPPGGLMNSFQDPTMEADALPPSTRAPLQRPARRRVVTPSATTATTPSGQDGEPEGELGGSEFKALANILNHLINQRKEKLREEGEDVLMTTTLRPSLQRSRTDDPLSRIILGPASAHPSHRNQATTPANIPSPPGQPTGQWIMMNPGEKDPEAEDVRPPTLLPEQGTLAPPPEAEASPEGRIEVVARSEGGREDPEEAMFRELSSQLADLVRRMKKKKKNGTLKRAKKPDRPRIIVLRNGTAEGLANRQYNLVATITLIRDGKTSILVDTGLGTDINKRTELLRSLEDHGVPPPAINVVVSSHGHPDHAGNVHEFPDAVHYHGWFVHERTVFNLSDLFDSDRHHLTPSISLLRVPGHTSEDIAVLVRDAEGMGNVAVAGDVFIRREDIDNPREWSPLSADEKAQMVARQTLICRSDWIVPGHGPPFAVDNALRKLFKC